MNLFLFDRKERIKAVFSAYIPVFLLFLLGCFSSVSMERHWSAHTYMWKKKLLTPANYLIMLSETARTSLFYPWWLSFEEFLLYTRCNFLLLSYSQTSVEMESFHAVLFICTYCTLYAACYPLTTTQNLSFHELSRKCFETMGSNA